MDDTLFSLPPIAPTEREEFAPGTPRLQRPNREQLELRSVDLDGLLPADHRARLVWAFTDGLDLGPLYARIRAVEGHPGRPPIDPAILTALWLYATLDGVGSARALDRLCAEHDAYRWLAGGVGVNYHTLAAFRVEHADVLDRLLTESVAALLADGLVTMAAVAQDGMRVRAGAGAASYRRRPTLERFLAEAEAQVAALKAELDDDPAATSRRVIAARERAATERAERVRRALAHLPELEAAKRRAGKPADEARASTTDHEAKVTKMADGGYRPAYNVQFAADTKSQVIVGLDVIATGNDQGQLRPMVRQLQGRYGRAPDALLADAGFLKTADIDELACGTTLYVPVRTPEAATRDPYQPLPDDSPAVAAWRIRMGTDEAKELYKDRAATAECVNAIARNRGLQRFGVRGREKARAIGLWFALAHSCEPWPSGRPQQRPDRGTPREPRPTGLAHRGLDPAALRPGQSPVIGRCSRTGPGRWPSALPGDPQERFVLSPLGHLSGAACGTSRSSSSACSTPGLPSTPGCRRRAPEPPASRWGSPPA